MKSLRLILWDDCNRKCKNCANNNNWDVEVLSPDESLAEYDEILLTGGEPMLYPRGVRRIISSLKQRAPKAKYYMYTALARPLPWFIDVVGAVDGVTLTIYTRRDMENAKLATTAIFDHDCAQKSYRLNTFIEVDLPDYMRWLWDHQPKEFIEDCPLPPNETLRRWR